MYKPVLEQEEGVAKAQSPPISRRNEELQIRERYLSPLLKEPRPQYMATPPPHWPPFSPYFYKPMPQQARPAEGTLMPHFIAAENRISPNKPFNTTPQWFKTTLFGLITYSLNMWDFNETKKLVF